MIVLDTNFILINVITVIMKQLILFIAISSQFSSCFTYYVKVNRINCVISLLKL